MSATQDYVALEWVKGEIFQLFEQAQNALEAVAISADDASSMRACLTAIHQAHGTLKMVQLAGPTQIVAEMEELAQGLMAKSIEDVGLAQETLMQALLQMPGYLERIHREQQDAPEFVGLLVNELRVARDESALANQAAPSNPAASTWFTVEPDANDRAAFEAGLGAATVKKLRGHYRQALTGLVKKQLPRENLGVLAKVLARLGKLAGDSAMANLFELGLAVIEGVSAGALKLDIVLINELKAIDAELKRLADEGAKALGSASAELGNELLTRVQLATKTTPGISAARAKFRPATAPASNTNFGPDDDTLAAVANILIEEFSNITDKLDLYVRSGSKSKQEILDLVPALQQIVSTLSVVGLDEHRQAVLQQLVMIAQIEQQAGEAQDEQLIEMARAFLQIDSALRDVRGKAAGAAALGSIGEAQATVIRETRNSLAQVRDVLVDFITAEFDQGKLEGLSQNLRDLRGGLTMVNQDRSANVLLACAVFVESALIETETRPDARMLDDLADALTSIDYYLERLLESASDPYLQMIEVAESAVAKLGYDVERVLAMRDSPVLPAVPSQKVEISGALDAQTPPLEVNKADEGEWRLDAPMDVQGELQDELLDEFSADGVIETPIETPINVSLAEPLSQHEPQEESLVDHEILDIFFEEVEEVLATIDQYFTNWRADEQNTEALMEVRRAFHTLKGSGRMVGATVIGDLALATENLLNRLLDGSLQVTPTVYDVVEQVIGRMPAGIAAFKNNAQQAFEITDLVSQAEALTRDATPTEVLPGDEITAGINQAEDVESGPEVMPMAADEAPWRTTDEFAPEAARDQGLFEVPEVPEVSDVTVSPEGVEAFQFLADSLLNVGAGNIEDMDAGESDTQQIATQDGDFQETELLETELLKTELLEKERHAENLEEIDSLEIEAVAIPHEYPALLEIFVQEAQTKLAVISAYLANPEFRLAAVVAAFHNLKGSAGAAGVDAIVQIAAPLEALTQRLLDTGRLPTPQVNALIRRAAELISGALTDIPVLSATLPGVADLLDDVAAVIDADVRPALFNFKFTELLSRPAEALSNWNEDSLETLAAELDEMAVQAEALGQYGLLDLIVALVSVYANVAKKPAVEAVELLVEAHEALVVMFDQVVAGQIVQPAPSLIAKLAKLATPVSAAKQVAEPLTSADSLGREALRGPEDTVDEDVLPLFLEEAEELIESLDQSLLDWSADTGSVVHLDDLLRHLHTLKGGARISGLNALGELAHEMETLLAHGKQTGVDLNDGFFALMNQHLDEINRRVALYQDYMAGQVSLESLASSTIHGARDAGHQAAPLPTVGSSLASEFVVAATSPPSAGTKESIETEEETAEEIDEEILAIFTEEADELLELIEQSIHNWSEDRQSKEPLVLLLRYLHTLKGGARLAGLTSLGEFAHGLESFLNSHEYSGAPVDDAFYHDLNAQRDELARRVENCRKSVASEAGPSGLAPAENNTVVAETAIAPAPAPAQEAINHRTALSKPPSEMVRVASDLLEQLINLAGESSVTRGRIEQTIADFGGAIGEMADTIARIREQVRLLDIETEFRETVFGKRLASEGNSAFDELEMDRYTLLQEISRALNESSSDMMDLKETLLNKSRDTETLLHQQARISAELQEGLTRTRMVPFARLIPRLRRIVRQISAEVGKSVRFDAFNMEGELDRNVLERIVAPLEHMLRNAVDHGIEPREQRLLANKPEIGRISLRLSREGGNVVLTVSDDGAGINVAAVKAKAIERGLIKAGEPISDHEVRQFIMHAGFSTAAKLTQISGRGVGMDVVNSEIKQLGGSLAIDSAEGQGTQFIIRIPFTVSINRALMVVVKEETYAVPLNTIEGIVRVSPYELEAYYQPDAPMFEYAGQAYRLAYMGKMLARSEDPSFAGQLAPLPVILARSGDTAIALQVDRVIGSREVVVKTLGRQLSDVAGIAGATVLGDGSVVIILDIMALVRNAGEAQGETRQLEKVEPQTAVRTVMIVDDSVTVRKVTSRLMERHGWEVVTAKDGLDALRQLQDIYPDIVLLDIEMPRMDGFEVLRSVRRDERLTALPIIMITSRTGEKHQQQAKALGVNGFLGKPFQEASLLSSIEEVLAAAQTVRQEPL